VEAETEITTTRRLQPGYDRMEGVRPPSVDVEATGAFYLEYLSSSDGDDLLFHLFAFPDESGSGGAWAPPEGAERMRRALAGFRDKANLPYAEGTSWCLLSWETDTVPEIVHFALNDIEAAYDGWLEGLDLGPGRVDGPGLLNQVQKRLWPQHSWYMQRMALLTRLQQGDGMRAILAELGEEKVPDVPEPDISSLFDLLFPLKPGMWFVRVRDMANALDRSHLARLFLAQL